MRTMYVAVVEVATKRALGVDDAMRTLADYRPVLGTSPRGWVEVQLNFSATGLAHACTTAAAIARAATGAEALACLVMTEVEHEARHGLARGSVSGGRHAAYDDRTLTVPRQPTETWERVERERGRHSA